MPCARIVPRIRLAVVVPPTPSATRRKTAVATMPLVAQRVTDARSTRLRLVEHELFVASEVQPSMTAVYPSYHRSTGLARVNLLCHLERQAQTARVLPGPS